MARSRGTAVLLLLAALAIVVGTAATVLSGRRAAALADPEAEPGKGAGTRMYRTEPRGSEPTPAAASLTVQVLRFSDDTPLAGAAVTAYWGVGGPMETTRTADGDGKAAFPGLLSGSVSLLCEAADHEPAVGGAELRPGANPAIQVRLRESAVIEGRVVAASDGSPVAGARVAAGVSAFVLGGRGIELHYGEAYGAPMRERSTTTDAEGRFRLRAGSAGLVVQLQTSAEGYAAEAVGVHVPLEPPAVARIEIRLERPGRIRGTVRDSRGAPVAGAHVSAVPPAESWMARVTGPAYARAPSCQSGADGAYALDGIAVGGVYRVQAYQAPPSVPGGARRMPDGRFVLLGRLVGEGLSRPVDVFLPPDPGEATADLVVPTWGFLSVTWRDAAGGNEGWARVLAFSLDSPSESPEMLSNATGGPGFGLNLREGRWRIVVDSERHGCGEAEAVVVAEGDAHVEVVVGTAPSLQGVVVDGEGNPLSWVLVEAANPEARPPWPSSDPVPIPVRRRFVGAGAVMVEAASRWSPAATDPAPDSLPGARLRTRTDASGRFLLDGLRPGSAWSLFVRGDVLSVPPTGPFTVPSREIRLVATRRGGVAGRLVLPPGVEVPALRSIHFASDGGDPPATPTLRSTSTWVGDRFSIPAIPPGRGSVWVAAGDLFSLPVEVDVREGGTTDVGEILLEKGFRIEGRVVDAAGRPLPKAFVKAHVPGAAIEASSDAEGRIALEGLPPGTVVLSVDAGGPGPVSVQRIEVPSASPIEIRIIGRGILRGTARDSGGVPLAGWWVATRPVSAPADPWTPRVPVGHRGDFEVVIESGEWSVAVLAPGSREPAGETTASVPEGGEAAIDLRVSSDVRTGPGPR